MNIKKWMVATALLGFLGPISAFSSQINVASVTASSTFYTYNVNNLVNGAGLTGDLHSGDWQGKWITNGTPTGWLIFDLGAVYNVLSASIWNYGPGCCGNERSVKDLGIMQSTDGITFTNVGSYILNQPQTDPFAADTLALNMFARYFRFNLNSTYDVSDYIGLSEVRFNNSYVPVTLSAVPVPATALLLGSGLLALFGVMRRKAVK